MGVKALPVKSPCESPSDASNGTRATDSESGDDGRLLYDCPSCMVESVENIEDATESR